VLRALAQGFQRTALLADGAVAFAAPERAFRLAHRVAGLAKSFAGLHAHAFKALHQRLELALQLALALLQLAHRLGEFFRRHRLALARLLALPLLAGLLALAILALLLLAARTLLLLSALHLIHAERLVHHLLLAAHDLAELVHLLAHLGVLLPVLAG